MYLIQYNIQIKIPVLQKIHIFNEKFDIYTYILNINMRICSFYHSKDNYEILHQYNTNLRIILYLELNTLY